VLEGAGQGAFPAKPHEASGRARLADLALDAIAEELHGRSREARMALTKLRSAVTSERAVPHAVWTAARIALAAGDAHLQEAGLLLVSDLLERRGGPPRGYLDLVPLLREAGRGDLVARALTRATRAREPLASRELAAELVREAWRDAQRGERQAAIAKLRRARELAR
jgi:hypothetical protein